MKKLICGPLATLSHEAFRRLVEQFGGVDEYYTEMINAPSLLQRGPFEKYYLINEICPQKIVWQLTGHDADAMAAAAKVLANFNGIGIDINMGCCAPEIVRSGAGIAWMLKPPVETLAMVQAVKAAIDGIPQPQGIEVRREKMRLSVKLRLGGEDFIPQKFFEFCEALADCGVGQITLHPRTQKEKLTRPPRRHFVQELAALLKPKGVSVIYNGNVKGKDSALAALKECPDAAGIMISRACVQKPWIFAELRATLPEYFSVPSMPYGFATRNGIETAPALPTGVPQPQGIDVPALPTLSNKKIDLLQLGLDYIAALQIFQPPEFFKTRMQRFFAYYCDNFSFAHYIKTKMLNCTTPEQATETFSAYFGEVPSDRFFSL